MEHGMLPLNYILNKCSLHNSSAGGSK